MSLHKTVVQKDSVQSFLDNTFPEGASALESISGGEGSQAYGFVVADRAYVIRVTKHDDVGFKKDAYASTHFASSNIPIPAVHSIGKINSDLNYCITEKAEGKILERFNKEESEIFRPDLFRVLDSIHAVGINNTSGYGVWDGNGEAHQNNWKDVLLKVNTHTRRDEGELSLFKTSFLEEDFWDRVYVRLVELAGFSSDERLLVHGDYGFSNVLAHDGEITGVIDWENAMYGDFMYDIAWLCYWSHTVDYKGLYLAHSKSKGREIEHFEERLLCNKLAIGLGSLSFFAYSNQRDKYEGSKKRLEGLLS